MTDEFDLARLLSRKEGLSVLEKEAIEGAVITRTAKRTARQSRRLALCTAATLGAAAAAAALVFAFAVPRSKTADEFSVRGGGPTFRPLCRKASVPSDCSAGATLYFEVRAGDARYFAAFGKREDGAVIWYFPEMPSATSLDLEAHGKSAVLDRGVALGAEHTPGKYLIEGAFSKAPLRRDDIKRLFDARHTAAGSDVAFAERTLWIK